MKKEGHKVKSYCFLYIFILCFIFAPASAIAELSEAAQLRLQCEEERQEQLAPLREKEIEECIKKQGTREDCETKLSDFGNASRSVSGGSRLRMFDDLPSCVAAREAEHAEEQAMHEERKKGEGTRDTVPGTTRDSSAATTTRDSSTGTTTRDAEPGTTRDSSLGTTNRDTEPGKKRDTQ